MRRKHRRAWSSVLALVFLAVAAASGCDIGDFFGANWNINLYLPLGLASSTTRSDLSTASTIPSLDTASTAGALNVPVLGNLSSPAGSTAT